jgi:hypothetical protein
MSKRTITAALIAVAAICLVVAGLAFAEGDPPSVVQPGAPAGGCQDAEFWGQMGPAMPGGMMAGRGPAMMGAVGCPLGGPMHTAMQAALAKALGLTPEALAARLQAGETPPAIAADLGLSRDEFLAAMRAAHAEAWAQSSAQGRPMPMAAMSAMHARRSMPRHNGLPAGCPWHAIDD